MSDVDPSKDDRDVIAIVGMAARFPGAPDIESFWHNLSHGIESITFFDDEELLARGVSPSQLSASKFVKASPVLTDIDQFDAPFFGCTPAQAALLDPQQRLFLQCAWHALEHAGIDPSRHDQLIGVFGGASISSYLLFNLMTHARYRDAEHRFEVMLANDKGFVCTRTAHALDLRGPSLDVHTGCSSSLVATELACEALLGRQCDIALAGGVSVIVPQQTGYLYQPGGITSPDGHCRAFDARGQGTLFGSGLGIVTLMRLEDALRGGHPIHALILSAAINNDGAQKVGFAAPSVDGQSEVIARALALAGVAAASIGYVEAHGTATALGDPVEVRALTRAYRAETEALQFCALGSVKTNIGHLDVAAGIAGLIKAVLAIEHAARPPSLHFDRENPELNLASTPFYVNARLEPWPSAGAPRRAAVSSFGVGGTNAHVILEQAPARSASSGAARQHEIVVFSAASPTALERLTERLQSYFREKASDSLSDAAYTLQVGRKRLPFRRACVCASAEEATELLASLPGDRVFDQHTDTSERPVVFMFPGGGAQYVNMGRELYQTEPTFRKALDLCGELLVPLLGRDLRPLLYPAPEEDLDPGWWIQDPVLALPALFSVEYSLAELLMSWGVRPSALIGHSLGEYVAACVAGVLSLRDALAMVVVRGRLFERTEPGKMLSVLTPVEEIRHLLSDQVSLAAVNGPDQCVVSGTAEAIDEFARVLVGHQLDYQVIPIGVAAHSHLVDPILPEFVAAMSGLPRQPPKIPFLSNVTGTWICAEDAVDASYWGRQLRQTVLCGPSITELLSEPSYLFVEVGPGNTLSKLVKAQARGARAAEVVTTLCHPRERLRADVFVLNALAKLWTLGVQVDFAALHAAERRQRVPLPSYPFDPHSYWVEPNTAAEPSAPRRSTDFAHWFFTPTWQESLSRPFAAVALAAVRRRWLLFVNDDAFSRDLIALLAAHGQEVVSVSASTRYARGENRYSIDPRSEADYLSLARELRGRGFDFDYLVHAWSVQPALDFATTRRLGYDSLVHWARAWYREPGEHASSWWLLGAGLYSVESHDQVNPDVALQTAVCRVIPQEYPSVHACYCVDVGEIDANTPRRLIADALAAATEGTLAYRGARRWVRSFVDIHLDATEPELCALRRGGSYLITGGLGRVGLALAVHLAQKVQARLVLISRSAFPEPAEFDQHLEKDSPFAGKIRLLRAIEAAGGRFRIVRGDVGSETVLRGAIADAREHFGELHGIIHAAGITGGRAIKVLADFPPTEHEAQFVPKVQGTTHLGRIVPELNVDFVLLISSVVALFGGVGLTAYAAGNAFMDAFVKSPSARGTRWLSLNLEYLGGSIPLLGDSQREYALLAEHTGELLEWVITRAPVPHLGITVTDPLARQRAWVSAGERRSEGSDACRKSQRPALEVSYVPPATEHEQLIAHIWQDVLGIDEVGLDDNFFALGGDSLLGVRVMSKLQRALQRDVPVVSLYEGLTVRALAAIVDKLVAGESATTVDAPERSARRADYHQRLERLRAARRG